VAIVHAEMKRGLSALAPLVRRPVRRTLRNGRRHFERLKGIAANKATGLSAWPAVSPKAGHHRLGLLVAVPPFGLQLLHEQVEAFDVEMDNSSMELINYLSCAAARRSTGHGLQATSRSTDGSPNVIPMADIMPCCWIIFMWSRHVQKAFLLTCNVNNPHDMKDATR